MSHKNHPPQDDPQTEALRARCEEATDAYRAQRFKDYCAAYRIDPRACSRPQMDRLRQMFLWSLNPWGCAMGRLPDLPDDYEGRGKVNALREASYAAAKALQAHVLGS